MDDKIKWKRKPRHETILGKIARKYVEQKNGIIEGKPEKTKEQIAKMFSSLTAHYESSQNCE